jgi:hypothetical protein
MAYLLVVLPLILAVNTHKHVINIAAHVHISTALYAASQVTVSPPPLLGTPASFFLL